VGFYLLKLIIFHLTRFSNKDVYESEDVVTAYSPEQFLLQKPEEAILNELRDKLPEMRMLDIGVGAGRTTQYFAPLAKEYYGVDYASSMIKKCQQRYQDQQGKFSFTVSDARAMSSFKDNYFDFVLFSFNGIDYVNNEDRIAIFKEIRRVTRKGGFFGFSTHNLNSVLTLISFRSSVNVIALFKEIRRLILMRFFNRKLWNALRGKLQKQNYLIFNDGAHYFGLNTYYITPENQIKKLTELGFSNIDVFGLDGQRIILNSINLQTKRDPWLYYLCNNNK
jgi:ubiquinone/menaquinone biosynthesis C-methylase UbiE